MGGYTAHSHCSNTIITNDSVHLFTSAVDTNRLRVSRLLAFPGNVLHCNYSDVISVTSTGRCKEVEYCGVDSGTLEGKTEIKTRCKKLKWIQGTWSLGYQYVCASVCLYRTSQSR